MENARIYESLASHAWKSYYNYTGGLIMIVIGPVGVGATGANVPKSTTIVHLSLFS